MYIHGIFHVSKFFNILALQEQWKSSTSGSKRRPSDIIDDEGGHSEKRRRKGGKKRRKDKHSRSRYETEEAEAEQMDYQEAPENEDADTHYRESTGHMNEQDDEENAQNPLEAVGLEDSDIEDEVKELISWLAIQVNECQFLCHFLLAVT